MRGVQFQETQYSQYHAGIIINGLGYSTKDYRQNDTPPFFQAFMNLFGIIPVHAFIHKTLPCSTYCFSLGTQGDKGVQLFYPGRAPWYGKGGNKGMGLITLSGYTPDSDDRDILFVEILLVGAVVFHH